MNNTNIDNLSINKKITSQIITNCINLPCWTNFNRAISLHISNLCISCKQVVDKLLINEVCNNENNVDNCKYKELELNSSTQLNYAEFLVFLILTNQYESGSVCINIENLYELFKQKLEKTFENMSKNEDIDIKNTYDFFVNNDKENLNALLAFIGNIVEQNLFNFMHNFKVISDNEINALEDESTQSQLNTNRSYLTNLICDQSEKRCFGIINKNKIYIPKLLNYEIEIANFLNKSLAEGKMKSLDSDDFKNYAKWLNILFPSYDKAENQASETTQEECNWQKVAAAMSLLFPVKFIVGGPGTGKTTTVAKILALLVKCYRRGIYTPYFTQESDTTEPRIALAAPTGKAASRMKQSLSDTVENNKDFIKSCDELFADEKEKTFSLSKLINESCTIHSLLGIYQGKSDAQKYNSRNKLIYDIIVIDETSMIDISMMYKLISAIDISKTKHVIFLGDKDQLSSVEAGSVLGDISNILDQDKEIDHALLDKLSKLSSYNIEQLKKGKLANSIASLIKSWRFDANKGIGKIAFDINRDITDEEIENTISLLNSASVADVVETDKNGKSKWNGKVSIILDEHLQYSSLNENECMNKQKDLVFDISIGNIQNSKTLNEVYKSFSGNGTSLFVNNDVCGYLEVDSYKEYFGKVVSNVTEFYTTLDNTTVIESIFLSFNKYRILSPIYKGVLGVDNLNSVLSNFLFNKIKTKTHELPTRRQELISNSWFPGLAIMITNNDRTIGKKGVYNGDIGICGFDSRYPYMQRVWLQDEDGGYYSIPFTILSEYDLAFAMSIHKSQGSEFTHCLVVIPNNAQRLLSKELIYTGVTRAKTQLTLVSDKKTLISGAGIRTKRASGLNERLNY